MDTVNLCMQYLSVICAVLHVWNLDTFSVIKIVTIAFAPMKNSMQAFLIVKAVKFIYYNSTINRIKHVLISKNYTICTCDLRIQ